MFRQGDVLIIEVNEIPDNTKPVPRENGKIILAHGEVTGHAHAIASTRVKFLESPDGERFLTSETAFTISHEEHAPVEVPPGNFCVIRQREYTPQEIRNVAD